MPTEMKDEYINAGGTDIPTASYMTPFGPKPVQIWNPQALVSAISDAGQKPKEWWDLIHDDDVAYLFEDIVKDAVSTTVIKDRRINVLQLLVTTVTDRIKLTGWEIPEKERSDELKDKMDEIDDELGIMRLSDDIFSRAEAQGQTFLIPWPTKDGKPGLIRTTPATTVVGYPDDGSSIWPEWAARLSVRGTRLDLFLEDRIVTWTKLPIPEAETPQITGFSPALSDTPEANRLPLASGTPSQWRGPTVEKYDDEWPDMVPVIPFVSTQITKPFSAVKPAIGCQRALDHGMAIDTVAMEMTSFPVRYTATKPGDKEQSEIDLARAVDPDNTFDEDDPSSINEQIDLKPGGFIDFIADIVGEFEAADPDATLSRLAFYAKTALVLCSLPLSVWEGTTANNSGELMRRELHSLLSKVRSRISAYRASYRRVWRLLLAQNGMKEVSVKPIFDDPAMPDELYIWELVLLKLEAGLPLEQALREAGVPEEVISEIDIEKAEENVRLRRGDAGQRRSPSSVPSGQSGQSNGGNQRPAEGRSGRRAGDGAS